MQVDEGRARMRPILLGVVSLVLAGCSVMPSYDAPEFPFASTYSDGSDGVARHLQNTAWWERFDEPRLNALVRDALEGSINLELARERLKEAEAAVGTVPLNATLDGSSSLERTGGTDVSDRTRTETALDLSWLLDPYGQRHARLEAARARAEVAVAEVDAARLLLLSQITSAYTDLRFFQRSLALRRKQLDSRKETVGIIQAFVDQGQSSRLDLVQAEALVAETQALIPPLKANIRVQRNRLRVLTGEPPGPRKAPMAGPGTGQPRPRMAVNTGIPADLLRNRPDIRISERRYYAAVADIGAARADLYPRLFLNGTMTLDTIGSSASTSYFFGPAVQLPSLPNSPRAATVDVESSQARQALTEWRLDVLQALQEVEDGLARYATSREAVVAARGAVDAYSEAVALTKRLIMKGGSTVRDLIEAEQRVAEAEITHAQNVRRMALDFIALNVALGSGTGHRVRIAAE